ncbi:MAG TPA: type II toxin-antitoxin system PemK/MazF family toxin [bacterium]|nr:type II toxin-antitoxin system PemK/MazF family toxin [bacterium]
MTACEPGDLVLVPFPFTDLRTTKKRPALVLATIPSKILPTLFVVAMATSQTAGEKILGDYDLQSWKEAGLLHPSRLRLAKVVSLEEDLIQKRLGQLQKEDRKNVAKEFRRVFKDWQ